MHSSLPLLAEVHRDVQKKKVPSQIVQLLNYSSLIVVKGNTHINRYINTHINRCINTCNDRYIAHKLIDILIHALINLYSNILTY